MKRLLTTTALAALLLPAASAPAENWVNLGIVKGESCYRYFDRDSVQRVGTEDARYRVKRQCSTPQHFNALEYHTTVVYTYLKCPSKTFAVTAVTFYDASGKQLKHMDGEKALGPSALKFMDIVPGSYADMEHREICL